MSDARIEILARIRRNAGAGSGAAAREAARRAASAPRPIPARARGAPAALVERFVAMATEAAATVERVAGPARVPEAVAAWLGAAGLPPSIVTAPDESLDAIPWSTQPGLRRRRGPAEATDRVAVTPAFAGIAETGTLMVRSGPATPNALHFLPDVHIALLRRDAIVGGYEDAWRRLTRDRGALPRTVVLITGPSRSSDIERTVQIGVHGPRRLRILLLDGDGR